MSTGEFGWFKQYMWRHSLSRKKPDWKHCVNFPLECGTERIGFVEELLAQWFYAGNRGRKKAVECDFSPEYDGKKWLEEK